MPFRVIRNDITKMNTDAIVNSANPRPAVGLGTDSAVYEAAGAEELLAARQEIGPIGRGQAAVTPGFRLKAKYIIHTVGPVWKDGRQGEDIVLRACYENCLRLAAEHDCESIAFPFISTGNYGFPKELALKIVTAVVEDFLKDHEMMIYLVVYDRIAAELSAEVFSGIEALIDDAYIAASETKLPDDFPGWDRRRRELHRYEVWREREAYQPNVRPENADLAQPANTPLPGSGMPASGAPAMPDDMGPYGEGTRPGAMPDGMGSFQKAQAAGPAAGMAPPAEKRKSSLFHKKPKKEHTGELPALTAAYSGRKLKDLVSHPQETFQQMLLRLIREKGLTNAEAYKRANQDKKLFSKIKNDEQYQPKKKTAMAFALALELSLDEAVDLLAKAGYAFSPSNPFDLAIQYFIQTGKYNIYDVEIVLYDLGLDSLCNY